jgi:FAD/FMN-containing dehydrogenase
MARTVPDWGSLAKVIDGDVALPGSPTYETSRRPFNVRHHDVLPEAIVSCATPHDVSEVISFARFRGVDIVARSGGHSFAGHSTSRGIVADVTPMRSVSVSGGVATVGAGARLGEVYETLQGHGLAIPAGTCPSVGVAGLTLGGGLGILGRKYGVTSDLLLGAEIVLADGRILRCDEHHDEDLFWALRGAGTGTFGIVTSLVFRTVPAPDVTNVHLRWSFARAVEVIAAWQAWAPTGPDELAASLKVTATGDAEPSVDLYAAFLGVEPDVSAVLDDLVGRAGADPVASSRQLLSFPETRRYWARLGEEEPAEDGVEIGQPVWLSAKSEFFRRQLSPEALTVLLGIFERERAPGETRELDFMPWGGAYNRVRPDATAFVHREERFLLKHAAVLNPGSSVSEREAASRQVAGSWASVHPWGSGRVFQNFADPDLGMLSDAYHGPNVERLMQVKARYDPANVFRLDGTRASE